MGRIDNLIFGAKGEISAEKYLISKKYKILEKNYICKLGEIDIIALYRGTYVFVEVKARTNINFGLPREAVTLEKQRKIKIAATLYLQKNKLYEKPVRFDVIEIYPDKIEHLSNCF